MKVYLVMTEAGKNDIVIEAYSTKELAENHIAKYKKEGSVWWVREMDIHGVKRV